MDDERFAGITYTHTLCLCILHNVSRHPDISRLIYIDMTVSRTGLDYGHRAVLHNICDQPRTAPRDQDVDTSVHFHHIIHNIAACILHQYDHILAEPLFAQPRLDCVDDCLIRVDSITSAAQDNCISRLKAEPESICRHVRAGLIDDPHNTEGHSFLPDPKAIRPRLHIQNFTDRILKPGNLP